MYKRGKKNLPHGGSSNADFFPFMFTEHEWKFMGTFEGVGRGVSFHACSLKNLLKNLVVFKIHVLIMLTT